MIRKVAPALLVLSGCARSVGQEPPSQRPSSSPSAASPASRPVPTRPALALEPVLAQRPLPLVLVAPAEGAVLSAVDAARQVIAWQAPASEALLVELALDGARARPLDTLPAPPTLGALLEPGSALEAGEHYVLASVRAGEPEPAAHSVVRFSVGTPAVKASPIVHCSRPAGTLYAAAGAPLLLDFATHGFVPGRDGTIEVRAFDPHAGPESERGAWLEGAGAQRFSAEGAVDLSVELVLWDNDRRPVVSRFGRDTCQVTRNDPKP